MRIVIDPGHGGKDSGAVNSKFFLTESKIVLSYGILLRSFLHGDKHNVILTREDDLYLTLPERVNKGNDLNADLFLSLHCNGSVKPEAAGIEVWTSPGQTESDRYASILYLEIAKTFFDRKMRQDMEDGDPDREARFYVLRKTRMPAVLLELGFITNDAEANWLRDFGTIQKYCGVISRSINSWAIERKKA